MKKILFPPNKKLGQNFLFDQNFLRKIVASCSITPNTVIIEIGSGYGTLTNQLAKTSCRQIISYEKDKKLFQWLVANNHQKEKITYLHADALLINWSEIRTQHKDDLLVIGNLPYYIANSLIINLLFSYQSFNLGVFLIQKEVAQRWIAKPDKYPGEYSALSVFLNYLTETSLIFGVPSQVFVPPSLVDGALVIVKPHSNISLTKEQLAAFWLFLKNCFRFRRKTLWNNLIGFIGNYHSQWDEYFLHHHYEKNLRPQNLSPAEYWSLFLFWSGEKVKKT